jgi:hypothetical protein
MTEFIFVVLVLVIAVVGMLVMTQVVILEQLGKGIRRGFLLIVLAIVTIWLLKALLLPILTCALVWLRGVMLWIFIIVLAAVAFAVLGRALFSRLATHNTVNREG